MPRRAASAPVRRHATHKSNRSREPDHSQPPHEIDRPHRSREPDRPHRSHQLDQPQPSHEPTHSHRSREPDRPHRSHQPDQPHRSREAGNSFHRHEHRHRREHRQPSQNTKYVNMLLALDDIPQLDNIMSSFFTWILLAGFVLFPGTFTSLQGSEVGTSDVGKRILTAVAQVPLFVIAFLCCGIGAVGMCYLWWKYMYNYIWILNSIFMPGLLNSLAGLISTIASIFGAQHGEFSTTGKVTIVVTAASTFINGMLALYYTLWKIRRVKQWHDQEMGVERVGRHGEGVVERLKKKKTREKRREAPIY